jgi:hypothetical protein
MSEPLAEARGLYVLTTQAEQPNLPGVAPLICANLPAFSLPAEDAWNLGTKLKPTECILKVDFLGSADSPARDEAEHLLNSSPAAEILA